MADSYGEDVAMHCYGIPVAASFHARNVALVFLDTEKARCRRTLPDPPGAATVKLSRARGCQERECSSVLAFRKMDNQIVRCFRGGLDSSNR